MLTNYFLVAIRSLWRNKGLSIINISGLAIGLSCCMLIFLYTKDEISYDRFHKNKDRLYRITAKMIDEKGNEMFHTGKAGLVQGPAFKQEIPEVQDYSRLCNGEFVIRIDGNVFDQPFLFADENFFSVFSFPLIAGTPAQSLSQTNSVVLSEDAAKKYFGSVQPMGKTLELQINGKFEPFVISAIAKTAPQNSTIKFGMLLPMKLREKLNPDDNWLNFYVSTFVLLPKNADPGNTLRKMTRVFEARAASQLKLAKDEHNFNGKVQWGLQPLLQIHLSKEYDAEDELSDASDPVYSYILTGIAAFIMLIACINFINLTMARSLKRSREIGIRKVIGGRRGQLILQFLGESFITCFIAFSLAILLATSVLPIFNELANKNLSLSYLFDSQLVAGFIALFGVTGFAAGFYPALVLSGFKPVETLYHRFRMTGRSYLSKVLVVLQFSLAALLIISTVFIYQQFHYLTNTDLGYNDKNLVVVNAGSDLGTEFPDRFKAALLKNPSIEMVALHNKGREGTTARTNEKDVSFDLEHIDDRFLPALQLPLVKGRNFSPQFPSDTAQSALVNETFARQAGWKDPIGQTVQLVGDGRRLTIVGVVRDYHFRPLNEKIGSQLFVSQPSGASSLIHIRIGATDIPSTLQFIAATFKRLAPYYPFSYTFKAERNRQAYAQQEKWKQIIGFSALFTIFISCIGLLGLTALSAEQRTKEFGIRKVLGASVRGIVQLASGSFLKLVLLANLIALPVAWWAVHRWLQNFAYHIDVHWWVFAAAILITMVIAGVTVSLRAIKAAVANPVKSLRME